MVELIERVGTGKIGSPLKHSHGKGKKVLSDLAIGGLHDLTRGLDAFEKINGPDWIAYFYGGPLNCLEIRSGISDDAYALYATPAAVEQAFAQFKEELATGVPVK